MSILARLPSSGAATGQQASAPSAIRAVQPSAFAPFQQPPQPEQQVGAALPAHLEALVFWSQVCPRPQPNAPLAPCNHCPPGLW